MVVEENIKADIYGNSSGWFVKSDKGSAQI